MAKSKAVGAGPRRVAFGRGGGPGESAAATPSLSQKLAFRFLVAVASFFYVAPNGAYRIRDAFTQRHPGVEYQDFLLGVFSILLAVMLFRQFKDPDKYVHLMQIALVAMIGYAVADVTFSQGHDWGLTVFQLFLIFDLALLHPARERLREL